MAEAVRDRLKRERAELSGIHISKRMAAELVGVTERTLRDQGAPRREDEDYDLLALWEWDRTVYRPRADNDDADAELTGSMGSSVAPGTLEILVSGRVVGTGATFQDALRDAQATLSCVLARAG